MTKKNSFCILLVVYSLSAIQFFEASPAAAPAGRRQTIAMLSTLLKQSPKIITVPFNGLVYVLSHPIQAAVGGAAAIYTAAAGLGAKAYTDLKFNSTSTALTPYGEHAVGFFLPHSTLENVDYATQFGYNFFKTASFPARCAYNTVRDGFVEGAGGCVADAVNVTADFAWECGKSIDPEPILNASKTMFEAIHNSTINNAKEILTYGTIEHLWQQFLSLSSESCTAVAGETMCNAAATLIPDVATMGGALQFMVACVIIQKAFDLVSDSSPQTSVINSDQTEEAAPLCEQKTESTPPKGSLSEQQLALIETVETLLKTMATVQSDQQTNLQNPHTPMTAAQYALPKAPLSEQQQALIQTLKTLQQRATTNQQTSQVNPYIPATTPEYRLPKIPLSEQQQVLVQTLEALRQQETTDQETDQYDPYIQTATPKYTPPSTPLSTQQFTLIQTLVQAGWDSEQILSLPIFPSDSPDFLAAPVVA